MDGANANGQQPGGIGQVFADLATEMAGVQSALSAQGVAQMVPVFEGEPKGFRDWIRAIEKYCALMNLPDDRKKMIAFQASKGAVSGYIQRYMNALPDSTWGDLKGELAKRFLDVTVPQFALGMLRQTRQKKGENVQMYAERILSLAKEAFLGQGGDAIERQLIDTFVDGLTNEGLKMTILRKKPDNLQEAISTATNEQNLWARVHLSGTNPSTQKSDVRGTPMEVDHYRHLKCYKCKQTGHTAKRCRNVNVHVVDTDRRTNRKIRCWGCGQEGHILKFCKQTEQKAKPPLGHGRSFDRVQNSQQQEN